MSRVEREDDQRINAIGAETAREGERTPSAYQPPLSRQAQALSHRADIRRYWFAFGRQLVPNRLPHSATQRGSAWGTFGFFFLLVFSALELGGVLVERFALPEGMSLAPHPLVHLLVVLTLAMVTSQLIPPHWERTVLLDHRGVRGQYSGLIRNEEWFIPLSQYRGVIPFVHQIRTGDGEEREEYGCALCHRDPRYTVLLAVSPIYRKELIRDYAKLLDLPALPDDRFQLVFQSRQSVSKLMLTA